MKVSECYLDNKGNTPELLLQPIKVTYTPLHIKIILTFYLYCTVQVEVEENSRLKVFVYHDVISQREIDLLTKVMEEKQGVRIEQVELIRI